jgi:serine/threonine protein kinase
MTRLVAMIERARNFPDRDAADRYVRDLEHLMTSRSLVGATVGNYQIVRQLAEGGMGVVYLATHSILGRSAAIKVLLPELSRDRDIVGRLFNEARAAAAIRHPGIVDIYDFGFLDDDSAYIAMELLEGETLGGRLRRQGALAVADAVQIGRQIAAALHAAHGKGITHRDLKPDNVFMVPDPEIGERIKLLDFGIAKLATGDTAGTRTRTGVAIGTPRYMSPEQCRGSSAVDHRSDLYSLGCILYELVAGRPVFQVDSANDIVAHHMYFQPEPVRLHAPSVPEPLAQLIQSLLAKDPAMRPSTAGDVIAILDRCRVFTSTPAAVAKPSGVTATSGDRPGMSVPTTLSGAAGVIHGRGAPVAGRHRSKWIVWLASAAGLAAAAGIVVVAVSRPGPASLVVPQSMNPAAAPTIGRPPLHEPPFVARPPASPPAASPATQGSPSPPIRPVLSRKIPSRPNPTTPGQAKPPVPADEPAKPHAPTAEPARSGPPAPPPDSRSPIDDRILDRR